MAIKKRKLSPRQKMINLMYLVLMAMLALNVSSDVLNGFSLVDEGLNRSKENESSQNAAIYKTLDEAMEQNPEKVKEWYNKAQNVRQRSDSLYQLAEDLKWAIVREADGKDGDILNINNKENLEAATHVMLAPGIGRGGELYKAINGYRSFITEMSNDSSMRKIISDNLSTTVPTKAKVLGKNWQEYMFENTPVIASVTLLTKLQNDVRSAEGEILHQLVANIDIKDVRVNEISAFVIPNAQTVVRGGRFSADIIMAAVDTTARPEIYIGNTLLKSSNGHYETICNSTGDFTLRGYLIMRNGNGEEIRRDFAQPYTVVEPAATVSGEYVATPSKVGEDVVITVTADNQGRSQEMGKFTFHVRKLPDPTAYIAYTDDKGNPIRYKGGQPFGKASLLNTTGISAAIDDGLLDIQFRVVGFETTFFDNMGNVLPEVSKSANFTDRQRDMIRRLNRGKRFYISRVHAIGPDGIERTLPSSMEVIIN